MSRHVRGSFFAEYVRMLRRRKDVRWQDVLPEGDVAFLHSYVDLDGWYPMTSFERMGVAILTHLEGVTLEAVKLWGQLSAQEYARQHPALIVEGEPVETLMRLKVMRATLFDFVAFDIPELSAGYARVVINYHMGRIAEEAACHQTLGFCEGALALAGATEIAVSFDECAWNGAPTTLASLHWT